MAAFDTVGRVVEVEVGIGDGGLEILWRDAGWVELIEELRPDGIGAELAEVEMMV